MKQVKFLSIGLAATLVALNAQASRSIIYPHLSSDFMITSANVSHDINLKDIQGNAIVLTTDSKLLPPGGDAQSSSLEISKVEVSADSKNNAAWVGIKSEDNKHEVRFNLPVNGMSVDGDSGQLSGVTTSTAASVATGQGVSAQLQMVSTSAPQHEHSEGWQQGCTYVVHRVVCDREAPAPQPRPGNPGPVAGQQPGHPGQQPEPGHQPDPGHGQNPPPPQPPRQPVCHDQAVDEIGWAYEVTDGDTWFDTMSVTVDDAAVIHFQQNHSTVHTSPTTECLPHIPELAQ